MRQEKVTKNTIRYAATDEESAVPTVYVKKSGLPEPAPQTIVLTMEMGEWLLYRNDSTSIKLVSYDDIHSRSRAWVRKTVSFGRGNLVSIFITQIGCQNVHAV